MPWEVSVSTHIDEETEALALLIPGCPGAQPAQAFLPHWSLPVRPALAGLPDSIFCHLHCQQAGTGHVGGAWDSSGWRSRGCELEKIGYWLPGPARQPRVQAKSRGWVMFLPCRPPLVIKNWRRGERPASRARVTLASPGAEANWPQ